MARSYNKLWKLMIDKNMSKTRLSKATKISSNIMRKLENDEAVPIEILEKICTVFQCDLEDVTEIFLEDNKDE